jgi:WD40 repeat protein
VFPNRDRTTEGLLFSPDGQLLAISSGKSIRLWAIRSGQCRRTFQAAAQQMAFSPDGRLLATTTGSPIIDLWDVSRGRLARRLPVRSHDIPSLAFSPDGRTLAVAEYDGDRVLLFDTHSWRKKGLLKEDLRGDLYRDPLWRTTISTLKFSRDGRTLATIHEKGSTEEAHSVWGWVNLWDTLTGRVKRKLEPEVTAPYFLLDDIDFSPDGRSLVGVAMDSGAMSRITLWDRGTGKARVLGEGLSGRCTALSFAAGGKALIAGIPDSGIWLFAARHPDTSYLVPTLSARTAELPLAVSPDGRLLATGSPWGPVKLWDVGALYPTEGVLARLPSPSPTPDLAGRNRWDDGMALLHPNREES